MKRRTFVKLLSSTPLVPALSVEAEAAEVPLYRTVTKFRPAEVPGMPGPYPGTVISVKSARSVSEDGLKIDAGAVREMMERGMRSLTGESRTIDAWKR